jgi:radical SAM-linked protein
LIAEPPTPTAATKVRLRFAKRGDLRLVSHHDLMRCLERTLRRARLPVAVSQGFNPRPKAVFALALGLGIEGRREVLELELAEPMEPAEVLRRLAASAPPGFDFLEAEAIAPGRPAPVRACRYALDVPEGRRDAARAAAADLLTREHWPYTRHRPDRTVELDLRPFVLAAVLDDAGTLRLHLKVTPDGSARPEEVIEALGLRDLLRGGAILARTDIELQSGVGDPPSAAPLGSDRAGPVAADQGPRDTHDTH